MKRFILPATFATALFSTTALAQSSEEVGGAAVGGTLGALAGSEIDDDGDDTEGAVIGALAGGTLGYAVGDSLDDDRDYEERYDRRTYRQGQNNIIYQNGRAYQRVYERNGTVRFVPVQARSYDQRPYDRRYDDDRYEDRYERYQRTRYDRDDWNDNRRYDAQPRNIVYSNGQAYTRVYDRNGNSRLVPANVNANVNARVDTQPEIVFRDGERYERRVDAYGNVRYIEIYD